MGKLDHLRKQVWKIDCGGNYKLAMLYMAEKTRSGVAQVKVQDIADVCGVSHSQAKAILGKLKNDGYLHVVGNEHGGNRMPCIYKITDKKGSDFRLLQRAGKLTPLYISEHKQVDRHVKAPIHGLIAVNDEEVNSLLLAGGL